MAIWMAIPSAMVFLSLTLRANVNRWVNIIVGILSMVILGATFFVGDYSPRYTFQAIIEGGLIAAIVWHVWKLPIQERAEVTP
jgi:hypothetical protein